MNAAAQTTEPPSALPSASARGWDASKKICLCGSARFLDDFKATELELTLSGHLVMTILVMFEQGELPERIWNSISAAHLRKIDACDEVLIINRDGYVGEATAREIEYAHTKGKPVKYKWAKHPNDPSSATRPRGVWIETAT